MPASKLISLDVAIRNIKSNFKKISNEDVFLQNSLGRCLAEPIYSKIDNPKYDVSSMDGYAINFKDFTELSSKNNSKKAINFKVIGESSAGNPFEKKIKNFEAVRIFTGAKVPRGCDVVIIQENVRTSSDQICISTQSNIIKYQNIRKKGLDFKKGECIFKIGSLIKSRHLGSIAMTGQTWLTVTRKPVVSILSTGNEILRVGDQLTKDQIPSGNNLMIAAMVTEFGGIPRILPITDDNENNIYDILKERILVLDGAMGTMIQEYKFSESEYRGIRFKDHPSTVKGNNDLLSLTQPDAIKTIHEKYLEAGADIIETNTFSSTSIGMADYNMESLVYDINFEAAKIAKEAALKYTNLTPNKPRFVAGSIGPTNRTASMSPDVNDPGYRAVTFDDLVVAYSEQINALIDGGVDILLIETIFDTLNAKAALFAVDSILDKRNISVPIMISGTITDASGRTLSGQTVEAFVTSLSHIPLLSIGLNCALGADLLLPYLKRLSKVTEFYTSAFPNAGLPNAFGEYDQTAEEMRDLIREYLESKSVNIIGGCCGTTPNYIKLIAEEASKFKPRNLN